VAQPLVLWHGRRLAIVPPAPARLAFVRVVGDLDGIARQILGEHPLELAPGDRSSIAPLRTSRPAVASSTLRRQLEAEGIPCDPARPADVRLAARRLGAAEGDREVALAVARAALSRAQRDPMQTLIALSREEERLERALGREVNAQEELLAGWGEANPVLASDVRRFREAFERHHSGLEREVERQVGRLAPTLAAVTGGKVAARLLAAADGLAPLARMPAGRVQLLGVRRRPTQGPGPRHGLIYRALGMETIPWRRQGAYARTLAASAVIAARIDQRGVSTGEAARLVRRLERRRQTLRREA
jgi:hypothetical protein